VLILLDMGRARSTDNRISADTTTDTPAASSELATPSGAATCYRRTTNRSGTTTLVSSCARDQAERHRTLGACSSPVITRDATSPVASVTLCMSEVEAAFEAQVGRGSAQRTVQGIAGTLATATGSTPAGRDKHRVRAWLTECRWTCALSLSKGALRQLSAHGHDCQLSNRDLVWP
jgi:hypothetical protein